MLFRQRDQEAIAEGRVTLTFRAWRRPQAKPGGRYRLGEAGMVEVTDVREADVQAITAEEARRAGYEDGESLLRALRRPADGATVYRVELRFAGPDTRPGPDTGADLAPGALEDLLRRLEALDARSERPWTRETLAAIADSPATRAADLAERLGRERLPFKADVRKLKRLGLTHSLEVGYRLTPRGERVLEALAAGRT